MKNSLNRFKNGDHLVVKRRLYTHHGIYIGNGEIIHYSGLADGLQSGPVEKTLIENFSKDISDIAIRVYKKTKYNPEEIVARVKSRLGENLYNVHSNNCEHFCCWAVTGKHKSEQVDFIERLIETYNPNIAAVSKLYTTYKVRNINSIDKNTGTAKAFSIVTSIFKNITKT